MKWALALGLATMLGSCGGSKVETNKPGSDGDHDGGAIVWPDEQFRDTQPKPRQAAKVAIPEIARLELDPGFEAYLVERHDLPTVAMTLVFEHGSIADPKAKTGLTPLCMSLMDEGTERLEKIAFEEELANLASSVRAFGQAERTGVEMRSLRRNLEPTLDLMVEMLMSPGMRKDDLERLRDQTKANLTQVKAAPGSLGSRLWRSVVYGADHPYGRITTDATLGRVALGDCKRRVKRLAPNGARLFVVGDITADEIKTLLGTRLAKWKGKAPKPTNVPPARPRKGTVFFAEVEGAVQSQIYVGHPGPLRTAADYEATLLMGQILGGGFSSRINMNIREKHGYAYGARAGFSFRKSGGSFAARSSVRSDATGAALREIATEIDSMRTTDVTAEELTREKDGILLSIPARFATGRRVLGTFSNLAFFGLPLDYYEGFAGKIEAVGIPHVRQAAKQHLQETGFKVLVVGDKDTVFEDLKAIADEELFGDGGLVVLDPDGRRR